MTLTLEADRRMQLSKLVCAVGFLLLFVGTVAAYTSPATDYEMSIFRSTPLTFWLCIVTAIVLAMGVAFIEPRPQIRLLAYVLGMLSTLSIVLLPITRNYYYLGHHDPLHHLGSAKDIFTGAILPTELFYPGMHQTAIVYHLVFDTPLRRSMMLFFPTLILLYFLFLPILARYLFPDHDVFYVVGFSAFLLLPVNWLSVHVQPHSASMGIMYAAFFVYLFVRATESKRPRNTVLVVIAAVFLLILHPQLLLLCIIFTAAAVGTRGGMQQLPSISERIQNNSAVLNLLLAISLIFFLWASGTSKFVEQILLFFVNNSPTPTSDISGAQSSLALIGVSILELFVKMFLITAVYCLLTALLAVRTLVRTKPALLRDQRLSYRNMSVYALCFGLAAMAVLFLAYLVVSTNRGSQYRVMGMMMVFVTILGAITLKWGLRWLFSARVASVLLTVCLVLALGHSVLIMHPSTWIYKETPHVTEKQMDGMEFLIEHNNDDYGFLNLKMEVFKWRKAILGSQTSVQGFGVKPHVAFATEGATAKETTSTPYQFADRNLSQARTDQYLIISDIARQVHVEVYKGVRYNAGDFASLERDRKIQRFYANGDVTLYLVQ